MEAVISWDLPFPELRTFHLLIAVNVESQMGGTDSQGKLVPLVISQNIRKHFRVRAVTARAVVQSDLIPVATAF